jgi:hypothetical protein
LLTADFADSNAKFFAKYVDPAHATAFARGFARFAKNIPAIPVEHLRERIERARASIRLLPHEQGAMAGSAG